MWLSLVERVVRDHEVASSNLVTPTSWSVRKEFCEHFFFFKSVMNDHDTGSAGSKLSGRHCFLFFRDREIRYEHSCKLKVSAAISRTLFCKSRYRQFICGGHMTLNTRRRHSVFNEPVHSVKIRKGYKYQAVGIIQPIKKQVGAHAVPTCF